MSRYPCRVVHRASSATEVFDAEEAADLFQTYHRSGDIAKRYAVRPVEGYRADGSAAEIA